MSMSSNRYANPAFFGSGARGEAAYNRYSGRSGSDWGGSGYSKLEGEKKEMAIKSMEAKKIIRLPPEARLEVEEWQKREELRRKGHL